MQIKAVVLTIDEVISVSNALACEFPNDNIKVVKGNAYAIEVEHPSQLFRDDVTRAFHESISQYRD